MRVRGSFELDNFKQGRCMAKRTPKGPKVHIKVTPEIIAESMQRDSRHCMIAEAIKKSYPDATHVSVDLATIRFTDIKRGLRFTYLTPRIAQVQLVKFDQGVEPPPFDFQIRSPQVTRSGNTRTPPKRQLSLKEQKQRTEAGKKLNEKLKRTRLHARDSSRKGLVPDRVGGKTPPLQFGEDGVPFSRRRAFGLRSLEY